MCSIFTSLTIFPRLFIHTVVMPEIFSVFIHFPLIVDILQTAFHSCKFLHERIFTTKKFTSSTEESQPCSHAPIPNALIEFPFQYTVCATHTTLEMNKNCTKGCETNIFITFGTDSNELVGILTTNWADVLLTIGLVRTFHFKRPMKTLCDGRCVIFHEVL